MRALKKILTASMSCDRFSGGGSRADFTAMESGKYIFLDNDIMVVSKEADSPIPFTITAKNSGGAVVAYGEFAFDANMEKIYLVVTSDGRFVEDTIYEQ